MTKNYIVFYEAPPPEERVRFTVSQWVDKELAIALFNLHDDAVMVVKMRGWFKRVIKIRRKEWL